MAGLVPAIHAFSLPPVNKDVDARDKRGHDVDRRDDGRGGVSAVQRSRLATLAPHDDAPDSPVADTDRGCDPVPALGDGRHKSSTCALEPAILPH